MLSKSSCAVNCAGSALSRRRIKKVTAPSAVTFCEIGPTGMNISLPLRLGRMLTADGSSEPVNVRSVFSSPAPPAALTNSKLVSLNCSSTLSLLVPATVPARSKLTGTTEHTEMGLPLLILPLKSNAARSMVTPTACTKSAVPKQPAIPLATVNVVFSI